MFLPSYRDADAGHQKPVRTSGRAMRMKGWSMHCADRRNDSSRGRLVEPQARLSSSGFIEMKTKILAGNAGLRGAVCADTTKETGGLSTAGSVRAYAAITSASGSAPAR
ncbi:MULTISPECIES: hypothetical protein [unclassified Mesorhizobium]|uniref:hypothetical protein n=1 Tax=unclassified Mesorhizobium TaxID=325217 RepID=UPI001ACB7D35|nr:MULTISPECIES: hypothetical protein [unclassified Mesorhizobium]MBN9255895.1 hypothetical protein [Mesorhizobium sp.]